jgi:hypothetical protein
VHDTCPQNGQTRRNRGDRGATLVEFAIVAPLLFLLLLGVIEFGFVFNNYQSVRQGSREGARQAVVAQLGTTTSCGITGTSPNVSTQQLICLVKDRVGLGDDTRVKVLLGSGPGYALGAPLVVCAQNEIDGLTGLFDPFIDGRELRSKVQMRIEKLATSPAPVIQAAEETAPSGGSWSWCTVGS